MTFGPSSPAKPKVYVTRELEPEAVAMLAEKYDVKAWYSQEPVPRNVLLEDVKGASAILCTISDTMDQKVLDAAGPSLKIIASMTADASHIDTVSCQARSIAIHTVPDLLVDVCAEMTCALLVVVARRLIEGHKAVLNGEWGLWKPMWICGQELAGKTLGILGYGRVGAAIARRMVTFELSGIIYCDKVDQPGASVIGAKRVDMDDVFSSSHFIICCLPLDSETKGIIDMKKFSLCMPECIFINTARGSLVNHDDLLKALQNKTILGAGLDVCDPEPMSFNHPLLELVNCVVTPHMSTATSHCRRQMALSMTQAVTDVLG